MSIENLCNETVFDKLYSLYSADEIYRHPRYTPTYLAIQATNICPNACPWCCLDCTEEGDYLDLNYVYPFLKGVRAISITGGEPLVHPELEKLVDEYGKKNKDSGLDCVTITLLTSGISPKANEVHKEIYYKNLEMLFKKESLFSSPNGSANMEICIAFSYSDGVEPEKRLEDFLIKYKELQEKYKKYLPIKYDIVSLKDSKQREKEIKDIWEKIYNKEVGDIRIFKRNLYGSGRGKSKRVTSNRSCHIPKEEFILGRNDGFYESHLNIMSDGRIILCCAIESQIFPLVPYANIYKHSIEEILNRREVYLELLEEFQEKNGKSCLACVSLGGFNDFLKGKLEKITKPPKHAWFSREGNLCF